MYSTGAVASAEDVGTIESADRVGRSACRCKDGFTDVALVVCSRRATSSGLGAFGNSSNGLFGGRNIGGGGKALRRP